MNSGFYTSSVSSNRSPAFCRSVNEGRLETRNLNMEVKRMNETVRGESGNKIPLCLGGREQLGGGGRGGLNQIRVLLCGVTPE